jgi:G:T/U-mismatch repair DNA glycosylase
MQNQTTETHPWKWYSAPGAKILMIGTFPPPQKRWSYDFFYPNRNNYFWKIISAVSGNPLIHWEGEAAVNERKEILDSLKMAITDMGHIISRTDDSAADEKLAIVDGQYMDIKQILSENLTIEKFILTSSSGKVSALKWFSEYCKANGIDHKIPKGNKPISFDVQIDDRQIKVRVLISPSPRPARRLGEEKLVEMYRGEILG